MKKGKMDILIRKVNHPQGKFENFLFWILRQTEKEGKVMFVPSELKDLEATVGRDAYYRGMRFMKNNRFLNWDFEMKVYRLTPFFLDIVRSERFLKYLNLKLEKDGK